MRAQLLLAVGLLGCSATPRQPVSVVHDVASAETIRANARISSGLAAPLSRAKSTGAPTSSARTTPLPLETTRAHVAISANDGNLVGVAFQEMPGDLEPGRVAALRLCSPDAKNVLLDTTLRLPSPASGVVAARGLRTTFLVAEMLVPGDFDGTDHLLVSLDDRGLPRAQTVFARSRTSFETSASIVATSEHVVVFENEPTDEDGDRAVLRVFRASDLTELAARSTGGFHAGPGGSQAPRLVIEGDTLYAAAPIFPKLRIPARSDRVPFLMEPLVVTRYELPSLRPVAAITTPGYDDEGTTLTLSGSTLLLESATPPVLIDGALTHATALAERPAWAERPICEPPTAPGATP